MDFALSRTAFQIRRRGVEARRRPGFIRASRRLGIERASDSEHFGIDDRQQEKPPLDPAAGDQILLLLSHDERLRKNIEIWHAAKAESDEPSFTLLARDPVAPDVDLADPPDRNGT